MIRYSNTQITTRYDGKRVYLTTRYPTINPSDTDIIIITNEGDYLDTLAYKYYNDVSYWWILALVNNIGKGRLSINPGTNLRIPTNLNEILDAFNRLNAK